MLVCQLLGEMQTVFSAALPATPDELLGRSIGELPTVVVLGPVHDGQGDEPLRVEGLGVGEGGQHALVDLAHQDHHGVGVADRPVLGGDGQAPLAR